MRNGTDRTMFGLTGLLFAALVAGQLLRIQPFSGTGGALTALDIALILANGYLLLRLLTTRQLGRFLGTTYRHPVWKWSMLFLAWAALTLLVNLPDYTVQQGLVAVSYLGRLTLAFSFAWLVHHLMAASRAAVPKTVFVAGGALLALGYIQLLFLGDFRFMAQYGWDPHIGRMLSTFFDPNYFGVFLVLALVLAFGQLARTRKRIWLAYFGLTWAGLFLTYSRSAWLAGAIALTGTALKRSWKVALLIAVVFISVLLVPNRLGERFADSSGIINQNIGDDDVDCNEQTDRLCDRSSSARVISWRKGLDLVKTSPFIGVGYNAYGYALVRERLLSEKRLASHSSQGSDSSLLNIWATTGIIGLGLFLAFMYQVLAALFRQREDWQSYGLIWFTAAWLVVSFFNNSLLYISILVPWLILLAVTLPRKGQAHGTDD